MSETIQSVFARAMMLQNKFMEIKRQIRIKTQAAVVMIAESDGQDKQDWITYRNDVQAVSETYRGYIADNTKAEALEDLDLTEIDWPEEP